VKSIGPGSGPTPLAIIPSCDSCQTHHQNCPRKTIASPAVTSQSPAWSNRCWFEKELTQTEFGPRFSVRKQSHTTTRSSVWLFGVVGVRSVRCPSWFERPTRVRDAARFGNTARICRSGGRSVTGKTQKQQPHGQGDNQRLYKPATFLFTRNAPIHDTVQSNYMLPGYSIRAPWSLRASRFAYSRW
jgi:hypothetical protein